MHNKEKIVKGLEYTEIMLKQAVDRGGEMSAMGAFICYNHVSDARAMLKEQEEKQLRCSKCSYHREDGWCGMHGRWVKEMDYCSFGAWKGR